MSDVIVSPEVEKLSRSSWSWSALDDQLIRELVERAVPAVSR